MKKINFKILALAVILAVSVAAAVPSLAANLTKSMDVTFRDIKLVIHGAPVTPKDVTGAVVEPFIYNGTTFLPVRAVAEALGEQVDWDGSTGTVYIGGMPGKTKYLTDVCPPYQIAGNVKVYKQNDGKSFSMCGIEYANGLIFEYENYALFNLNGNYSKISFDFAHFDESEHNYNAEYKIYLDGELVQTLSAAPDTYVKNYSLDLNGALQMKIESNKSWCKYCLGNIIVE